MTDHCISFNSCDVAGHSKLKISPEACPTMPWFGMDIGGSLTKLVYFEPKLIADADLSTDVETLKLIHEYLTKSEWYGETGIRDIYLQMNEAVINDREGTLHFIRFPTSRMGKFLNLVKDKGMATLVSSIYATGGGAYKFGEEIERELNLKLMKTDELDSLLRGMRYVTSNNTQECYFWLNPSGDETCEKVIHSFTNPYPHMIVNIGSGVSVLAVYGPKKFKRISGISIGGGTFLGLCCLLTGCSTFEEAIELAARGDSTRVDKLVRDIYGGDYPRFDLGGDLVASSFGHMNQEERKATVSREDLARSTLVTITNNISSIVRMCALEEKIETIVFVGNFLRSNPIAMKLLASAMEYWSQGTLKALFLEHEGYLGAIGCMMHCGTESSPRNDS